MYAPALSAREAVLGTRLVWPLAGSIEVSQSFLTLLLTAFISFRDLLVVAALQEPPLCLVLRVRELEGGNKCLVGVECYVSEGSVADPGLSDTAS